MDKISQLRIYTINDRKLDEWTKEWSEKVLPLRIKAGFQIEGAWIIKKESKFVWILTYQGPEDWNSLQRAYYESDDRKLINPNPARHISEIQEHFISSVI